MRELTDAQHIELRTNPAALPHLKDADKLLLLERRYPMVVGGVVTMVPYTKAKAATTYGAGFCASNHCQMITDTEGGPVVLAETRSWFCRPCTERFQSLLRVIESSWGMLEVLLRPGAPKGGERVASGNTGSPAPLDVNVADAMGLARNLVWSMVTHLVEDLPGKPLPRDQSTPVLAAWLARWHVAYFVEHPTDTLAQALLEELADVVKKIRRQIYPTGQRRLDIPETCGWLLISDDGKTRKCGGQLFAYVRDRSDGRGSEVMCNEDDAHTIDESEWLGILKAKQRKAEKK